MDDIRDILEKISDKQEKQDNALSDLKESVIRQEVALEAHMEQDRQMASHILDINQRLSEYNAQLQIHIAGVQQLKEMNSLIREELKQREKEFLVRLEVAEEPIKWLKTVGKISKWIGAVGTAAAALYALVEFIIK